MASDHTKKHADIMSNIENQEFDATSPMFYVQGVRGLYLGVESGIHAGSHSGEVCLGEETQESLFHIVDSLMKFDISEMMSLMPDAMDLFNNVKGCLKNKDSIVSYCLSEQGTCSLDKMIKNGQQQMFKIMGVFANLKSVVNDFPPSTSTEFFDIA